MEKKKRFICGHKIFRGVCIIFLMLFVLSKGETTTQYHLSSSTNGIYGLLVWKFQTDNSHIQIWKGGTKIWDEDNPDRTKNPKYMCIKKSYGIEFYILNMKQEDSGVYSCRMRKRSGTSYLPVSDIQLDVNVVRFVNVPNQTVCVVNDTLRLEWKVEILLDPTEIDVYLLKPNEQRLGRCEYPEEYVNPSECDKTEHVEKNKTRVTTLSYTLTRDEMKRNTSFYVEMEFLDYFLRTPLIRITGECLGENVKRTVDIGNKTVGSNLSEGKNADNGAKTAGATLGPIVAIAFFVVAIFICPH